MNSGFLSSFVWKNLIPEEPALRPPYPSVSENRFSPVNSYWSELWGAHLFIRPKRIVHGQAQYTPPTPTRLNSTVASRRRQRCVLGIMDVVCQEMRHFFD